jgi:hypothetical protein
MSAVGPDGLEDALVGNQPSGSRRGCSGQETGVLEPPLLLLAHVERPGRAEHKNPLGIVGGVDGEPGLHEHELAVPHDHLVGTPLVDSQVQDELRAELASGAFGVMGFPPGSDVKPLFL